MNASEAGRFLRSHQKERLIVCPICSTPVLGKGRLRYCSRSCANKANYRKNGRPDRRKP